MNALHRSTIRATIRATIGIAVAALACVADPAHAQNLVEVKIGTNNVVSDGLFYVAEKKGWFKEQGIQPKYFVFDAGPKMIAPLGTGQIDVASGASSAGLFNAVSRGINVRAVADKGSNGPSHGYVRLILRKQLADKVRTIADLKGLKIAQAAQGGSPGALLNEILKKGGVKYGDVHHVYMGYPTQVPALINGSVDAAMCAEVFCTVAVEGGSAVNMGFEDVYPNQQIALILYGGDFIKNKPELARKWMVAYLKAARFYNDALKDGKLAGPNAEELIRILTESALVKNPAIYRKSVPQATDPDGRMNLESLRRDWQFYKDQGFLEGSATVDQAVDVSFAEAAAKALGPYQPKK